MALVTVGSTPQDIDDIAAQAKELDEQIKDYTRDIQQLDREIGDTQKEKGLLETALMLSELQKNKLKVVDRLNAAKPDPEVCRRHTRTRTRTHHRVTVACLSRTRPHPRTQTNRWPQSCRT